MPCALRTLVYWSAVVGLGAMAGQAFLEGVGDAWRLCGTDLPNRVFGARMLWAGFDPYLRPALEALPPALWQPGAIYPGLSETTVAPTFLALLGSISWINYVPQRRLWWALGWLLLAGCALLGWHMAEDRQQRRGVVLLGLMVAASYFWRLHGERGQYYILPAFCIALESWLLLRARPSLRGWALGLAITIRPTLVAVLPLAAAAAGWRMALRAAVLPAAALMLTLVLWGPGLWLSYAENSRDWFRQGLDSHYAAAKFGPGVRAPVDIPGCDARDSLPPRTATPTLPMLTESETVLAASGLLLLGAGLLAALWARRLRRWSVLKGWALLPALAAAADFLAPLRNGYADVMFLPAVVVTAQALGLGRHRMLFLAAALAALATSLPPFESPQLTMDREVVLLILLAAAALEIGRRGDHAVAKDPAAP